MSLLILFFLSSAIINSKQIINEQTKEKLTLIDEHLKLSNQEDDIFKLIYGISSAQWDLDPHEAWDSLSYDVVYQVCEGLFRNNLSDPDHAIIPNLASDNGIWNGNNYTVPLRSGVYFHDGTQFNATAVKFSFDRLAYFMNITGILPSDEFITQINSVYRWLDGTPIINKTEIVNEYAIKFVLNNPYGGFPSLLSFSGSFILSPTSTNATGYIDIDTGDLVGTGPFVYDHYIPNDEVKFHAFENYWAGKPNITILKYSFIPDAQTRNNALLSGEVDIITDPMSSMYPTFDTDPDITLLNAGQDLTIRYMGMNNHWINVGFREAISYAINYSYIIEELLGGEAVRLKSPIPEGMRYANWSFNVATYDVSHARMIMQIMGFGVGWDTTYPGTNETEWQAATFATFNYSYNVGNQFREDVLTLLQNNLDLIGIDVTDAGMGWMEFLDRLYEINGFHRNMLQLFWAGWAADYNDPNNLISTLITNRTNADNFAKYNGGYGPDGPFQPYGPLNYSQNEDVQLLMEQAMFETEPAVRESLYDKIQQLMVERDMPWVFGYVGKNYDAYQTHILGYESNPIGGVRFFSIYQNASKAPKNIYIEGNQEWIFLKNSSRCTGNGTYSDPYVLKDLVIDGRNKSVSCIRIEDSNVFFRIENCTFFNSTQAGIEFRNVSNSLLINNNCTNNNYGIYINSNFNVNITANFIQNNSIYGITLNGTNNDLIFNNTFTDNYIHAQDNGTNIQWDNGIIGNFWSDYGGVDADDDGIGDTPYLISGTAGSQDLFPIWEDGDDLPPDIRIIEPNSNQLFSYNAPNFNVEISDANLDSMWYTLDGGLTNTTFATNGTIDQALWDALPDGNVTMGFYTNDTLGYSNYTEVTVRKDVEAPQITINSPPSSEAFANFAPAFSLNILEANLDSMWYTIDGGITNITFIGFSGGIDQVEWNKKGSGTVIIRFYVNDTAGNLGFDEVSVQKSIGYWPLNPLIIDDTGLGEFTWAQAALQGWCGGSGTWNNPYIIEYVIINGQNSGSCIEIRNSNVSFIIRYSIMSYSGSGDFDAGIKLNRVNNSRLYNINCSSNNNYGIILIDCLNNTITESTINDNNVGGILLFNSDSNSIIDNTQTIHNNGKYGILLNSSFYNIISGNYISNCQYGIYFHNSSENQITYNIFVGNAVTYEEKDGSINNNIDETNEIPSDGEIPFPTDLLIIISIIAIAAITSITVGIVVKKKLSHRTGTKLGRKMDKKQATIRKKLQKKMSSVDSLIKENKIDIALKNLEKVRKKADASDFNDIFNRANERITHCNKLQSEPIYKVEPESVVTPVVTPITTSAVVPVLKTKEKRKFKVFLSYSTLDSPYFQIPKIVEALEKYPDIEKVLFWEKDSGQNIVEFMEATLAKSDVFVLFCSENSKKSSAVKDEWQSAFQMRKKALLKIIPVYDKEDQIPFLLWQLLNVQYTKNDFQGFIENLHNEILRE